MFSSHSASKSQKFQFIHAEEGTWVKWSSMPKNILIVHKFCDENIFKNLHRIAMFLLETWDLTVFLEGDTLTELQKDAKFSDLMDKYITRKVETNDLPCFDLAQSTETRNNDQESRCVRLFETCLSKIIDMVICLGGDGTFLKISALFQGVVPPVLAFHLGSRGFLIPLHFESFPTALRYAIEGSPQCLMRSRLRCLVVRAETPAVENSDSQSISSRSRSPDEEHHFLNELVVDRGLSATSCDLVIRVNGRVVTHCAGDGIIVSTPTGSTAYSMATGASMVHPSVPAFVLTPINSLSLSSRAIVLPINLRLEISINPTARCKVVHFSCDGRSRACNLLREGDSIVVSGSPYSVPCLSGDDQDIDWFCRLHRLLHWNRRSTERANCLDNNSE